MDLNEFKEVLKDKNEQQLYNKLMLCHIALANVQAQREKGDDRADNAEAHWVAHKEALEQELVSRGLEIPQAFNLTPGGARPISVEDAKKSIEDAKKLKKPAKPGEAQVIGMKTLTLRGETGLS